MKTAYKPHVVIALISLLSINYQFSTVCGQGSTAFTYQGRLNNGPIPAAGTYDLRFALYDSPAAGIQQGITLTNPATVISNGLFTVTLDFGNQFAGAARWLEIGVRTNGGGAFATLSPRQQLTPTPYAIQAANAATATSANSVAAANVSGTLSTAQLPPGIITNGASGLTLSGSFIGNGSGLTNVPGTTPWQAAPGTNITAIANRGYVLTNGSPSTVTLPTTGNVGDVISISGQTFAGYSRSVSAPWTGHSFGVANCVSVASSADGTKLVAVGRPGQLSTSTDGGTTWTPRSVGLPPLGSQWWSSVASSTDGTKLVATQDGGSIYTSTDSGGSWTERTNGLPYGVFPNGPYWRAVACSSDGTKLLLVNSPGLTYTSTDSGVNWAVQTNGLPGTNQFFGAVASSADGVKLVAMPGSGGPIYTSTNSGASWAPQYPPTYIPWSSVASSADGTKLALVANGYPVYTSSDSGVTWTPQNNSTNLYWRSITMSADGAKIVAGGYAIGPYPGIVAVSVDSGVNWTLQTNGLPNGGSAVWYSVASSADGTKLAVAEYNGQIYTSSGGPLFQGSSPGATTSFQYLGNGNWQAMTEPASQIAGTIALSQLPSSLVTNGATGVNFSGTITGNGGGLTNVPGALPSQILSSGNVLAQGNQIYNATSAVPVTVTLPTNATVGDVVEINGLGAGGWQVQAGDGQTINGLLPGSVWNAYGPVADWRAVASSADGTKLVAATFDDRIYTSIDSGVTWIPRPFTNSWTAVASSADGVKLVAVTADERIYTSGDSGATWLPRPYTNSWTSVASSADGGKLVAVVGKQGPIYTSSDGGATWVLRSYTNGWTAVASSSDGTRLVAVAASKFAAINMVYVSTDSGVTWSPSSSAPPGSYGAVASSADGLRLVVGGHGSAIVSSDGGTNWASTGPSTSWAALASSADGTKLIAAEGSGLLYTSIDGGITWTSHYPVSEWLAVASSADGNKLVAVEDGLGGGGQIHVSSVSLAGAQGSSTSLRYAGNGVWQAVSQPESAANAPNTVVTRDASGSFSASTITATNFVGDGTGLTGVAQLVGGNTFFDNQSFVGNVGIGTSAPTVPLDVNGAAHISGALSLSGALSANGGVSGSGAGLTGLNASQLSTGTVPDIRLSTNVALRASGNTFSGTQVITNGNVGIGTNNPQSRLDIVGNSRTLLVRPNAAAQSSYLEFNDVNGSFRGIIGVDGIGFSGAATQFSIASWTSHPMGFFTAGAQRMTIDPSGNVGIGTTSPGFPLNFPNTLGDKISLWGNSGGHYGFGIQPNQLQIHTFTSGDDVVFGFGQSTNLTETMRIKGSGNVGIGTATPGLNDLQINPNFISASGYGLVVSKAQYGADIQINQGLGQGGIGLVLDNAGNGDANTSMLMIRNNMAGAGQTVMNVQAGGNVGIAAASPAKLLQIGTASTAADGMIRLSCGNGSASRTWDIGVPYGGASVAGTNYDFVIMDGGALRFDIDFNTGNVGIGTDTPTNKLHVIGGATFSSGAGGANQNVVWVPGSASWSFTSDRNAKDRVESVNPQSVLEKVSRIPINEWSYIGYDQRHIGPMAQDFHQQFPLNENDKALNDADLHGVALAAIQGLNQKVEVRSQKAEGRIQMLESENAALKGELAELKEMVRAMNDKLNGGEK